MSLAMTTDVEMAARILGFSRNHAYQQVRNRNFPGLIEIGGRRYKVSIPKLAEVLGCTPDDIRAMLAKTEAPDATDPQAA